MPAVQSLLRAFAILRVVATQPEGVGVSEIARQLNLPKSTVSRLLATLVDLEAVERVNRPEGFRIGPGIVALAAHVPYRRHLVISARSSLLRLAQATGETVNLCLPDGDQVHYIDQVQSEYHLQIKDWTGYHFPMHVTSAGKLFLAFRSPDLLKQYLSNPLQSFTKRSSTDPQALRRQLARIRERGYAWSHGESEPEIVGIAAPIWDETGQVMAAVSVAGPAFRFPPKGEADALLGRVVQCARRITERVGGQPNAHYAS